MQLVLKEAALLVFAGLIAGLLGALQWQQTAASLLYGSRPDPLHLGAAAIALARQQRSEPHAGPAGLPPRSDERAA